MNARSTLRKRSRALRSALGARVRRDASLAICRRLRASPLFCAARHIGFYWPLGEEVDLRDLLGVALRRRKRCYLPVMRADGRLWFVRYRPGTELLNSRHGIVEPRYSPRDALAPERLGVVFVPLLAFDRHGMRLGTGGGFYDRSFAFKRTSNNANPKLVGVGFACQEAEALAREAWDVPLAWVATEKELIRCG